MFVNLRNRRGSLGSPYDRSVRAGHRAVLKLFATVVVIGPGGLMCGANGEPAWALKSGPVAPIFGLGVAGTTNLKTTSYRIPSESMEPTLAVGEHILINLRAYRHRRPKVRDIVVFHPPKGAEDNRCGRVPPSGQACALPTKHRAGQKFVKRVVARGGDRVRILKGHVVLNGKRQKEAFTRPCQGGEGCHFPKEITIPKGFYFVMGDNRGASDDSRFWGPVPKAWILGKNVAR